jgi:LacI family transcriptional regulator
LRTAAQARDVALEVLASGEPDAIFSSQNLVTIGVVGALHELRLQHVIALVGFDDVPLANVVEPGVTVMAQDPAAIGSEAARLLFERMNGDSSPPAIHTLPTRLIRRGSGELLALARA